MPKVYLDFVLLDNFLIDFLLLYLALRFSEKKRGWEEYAEVPPWEQSMLRRPWLCRFCSLFPASAWFPSSCSYA